MRTASERTSLFCVLAILTGLLFPVISTLDAQAYLFWSNYADYVIARADNDGSNPNTNLCSATNPINIAANETYVLWNFMASSGYLGRAVEDGSSADNTWISGLNYDGGVTLDDTYIYWTEGGGQRSIGRCNLDGSGINRDWINVVIPSAPYGITVDDNYVYWTDAYLHLIMRANIDGTGLNTAWITGCTYPADVAVDGSYVYWSNFNNDSVGRANLDGTGVNQNWITGYDSPWGIDVDGSYVYVAMLDYITRANIDGSGLNSTWISHAGYCRGLAITASATPIDLVSFTAKRLPSHVKVEWATGAELETAGFHVWRADGQSKEFVRVTDELVPAEGGPAQGAEYLWLDTSAVPGTQYWYKLEDVSYSGMSAWHGPVRAMGKKPGTPGK